ncbi:MAG: AarF/UbiB family protein [Vicinamibacterales bacterium]
MGTSASARDTFADPRDRRRSVEACLSAIGAPPSSYRPPPPEGRLGEGEPVHRLRDALTTLGPVFASFARYLASRLDLLPRRLCVELAEIPDRGDAASSTDVDAMVTRQLGMPPDRRFFQFDRTARDLTLWTERHHAWLAPGVPVDVVIVRPDAAEQLAADLPLLGLIRPWLDVPADVFDAAIDDFAVTLRRRLDQTQQVAAFAMLALDAKGGGEFDAPVCYRDHCAPGVLTVERRSAPTLADAVAGDTLPGPHASPAALARRLTTAWLRQALSGHVVPFDFGPGDVAVDGERFMLLSASFEPHVAVERARFLNYVNAVASDDPDGACAWIAGPVAPLGDEHLEEELTRRLRQAVPFRDGEWSGDERLAESLLVQWRMARQVGWRLKPHHLHLYRGIHATALTAALLAPGDDVMLTALQDERMRFGLAEARQMADPRNLGTTLDKAFQEMVNLPQKLDNVLTLASEGRLRVRLQVPDSSSSQRVRNHTIMLVANLVALTGLASLMRQVAPAYGPGVERLGAVALLLVGGWLLVAAARL